MKTQSTEIIQWISFIFESKIIAIFDWDSLRSFAYTSFMCIFAISTIPSSEPVDSTVNVNRCSWFALTFTLSISSVPIECNYMPPCIHTFIFSASLLRQFSGNYIRSSIWLYACNSPIFPNDKHKHSHTICIHYSCCHSINNEKKMSSKNAQL